MMVRSVICVCFICCLAGCQSDEIRSYRIPKEIRREESVGEAKGTPQRLLAAIITHGDSTWFFKLVGPAELVKDQKTPFDQFIRSVRFQGNKEEPITWTPPADWQRKPGDKLRYATFLLGPNESPLELTVFTFAGEAGSALANINRWRGQIGLPEVDETEMGKTTERVQLDAGPATLVDLSGNDTKPGRMTRPRSGTQKASSAAPISYNTPAGWEETPDPKGIRIAVFLVKEGDRTAEVGLTRLNGSAGGPAANVNRWRGQIGLNPVPDADVAKAMRPTKVGGSEAQFVDLVGPEGGNRQRILGVIVPHEGQTWFITMKGPAEFVEKQAQAFDSFVKSIRFNDGSGSR